jgi:uncharacterized protein (DUF885 family)
MNIEVNGIVAAQDKMPYVTVLIDGQTVIQLTIAQARSIAADIVQMAARTEADAMIHQFFSAKGFPRGAGAALMKEFREFRRKLDAEMLKKFETVPETGEIVK